MHTRHRWMNWILKESAGDLPLLPWQRDRGLLRRPDVVAARPLPAAGRIPGQPGHRPTPWVSTRPERA